MKQTWKRLAACMLSAVLFVTLFPVMAQAKTTTASITMYKGEELSYTVIGNGAVSKVSSSNSKVVKAAKSKQYDYYTDLKAKKTGKATVTIKAANGTTKLNVTVKKLDMSAKLLSNSNGYVTFSVKNNTAQTFDKALVEYTLKNAQGEVVKQDSTVVGRVIAKKTAYDSIYIGRSMGEQIDPASCTMKVTTVSHDPLYTYKDVSSKVKTTMKDEEDDGTNITFNVTLKNTTNQYVLGYNYVFIYDAQDTMIGVQKRSFSMNKKATDTFKSGTISRYAYPDYDHYKVETQAYYSVRSK